MAIPNIRIPQLLDAKRRETETWNELIKHKVACRYCIRGEFELCLLGSGLSDDWRQAMQNLSKLLS
jgi:hypothetical protein